MKLKDFFLNCLSRRSFQFLSYIGIVLSFAIICILLFCICKNVDGYAFLTCIFMFILLILPTLGLVTISSIIAIYFKLLIKEHRNPKYRIKNKFLTQNQIYGFFAFLFYIFAIVSIIFLLYFASTAFDIYKEEAFHAPIYLYPFIIYTLIHIFIIKKV